MNRSMSLLSLGTFVAAFLAVTAIFITAKSYSQLLVGSGLYAILVFFGYKMLPIYNSLWTIPSTNIKMVEDTVDTEDLPTDDIKKPEVTVTDIDKRAFLKILGATGLSFFIMSSCLHRASGTCEEAKRSKNLFAAR